MSGAGTPPRNRQSYLNALGQSSQAGLALCHNSRHASRPSGVRLIVHVARQSSQTAGSQFVQRHAAHALARRSYCAGSAPARHLERRVGDACPAVARLVVLATAGPIAAKPEKPTAIHHRLQCRPGRADQPEHGPERADRPEPVADCRAAAQPRTAAGPDAHVAALTAGPAQLCPARPQRRTDQRHCRRQPRQCPARRPGQAQSRPVLLPEQRQ